MFKLPCSSWFSRSQFCLWNADPFSEIPTVFSFLRLIWVALVPWRSLALHLCSDLQRNLPVLNETFSFPQDPREWFPVQPVRIKRSIHQLELRHLWCTLVKEREHLYFSRIYKDVYNTNKIFYTLWLVKKTICHNSMKTDSHLSLTLKNSKRFPFAPNHESLGDLEQVLWTISSDMYKLNSLITSCIDAWKKSILSCSPLPPLFLRNGFNVRLTSAHVIIGTDSVKSSLRRYWISVSLKPPLLQANSPKTYKKKK